MSSVTVSLIISTYNWSEALYLVLQSALEQKRLPDEIVIADDGSTQKTVDCIRLFQEKSPIPIIHAWQADRGFRLAQSRNNAVSRSQGDYLVFVDGDTILHPSFIADHLSFAEKNTFVVGSRVLLQQEDTYFYLQQKKFHFNFLTSQSKNKLNAIRCFFIAYQLAKKLKTPVEQLIFKVRGCNMAVWRSDCLAINGFNQDICGWGREDSEFALRLFKKDLSMKRLKFAAIQYHLYHAENDRSQLNQNDDLLNKTLNASGYQCKNGLKQLSSR